MKNIIVLQKNEDGDIYCQEITKKGVDFVNGDYDGLWIEDCWDEGGTILLSELEEILDKEI